MDAEERRELDQALKIAGACIWCRRERAHGEGCVVAKALTVPTSPPVWRSDSFCEDSEA